MAKWTWKGNESVPRYLDSQITKKMVVNSLNKGVKDGEELAKHQALMTSMGALFMEMHRCALDGNVEGADRLLEAYRGILKDD